MRILTSKELKNLYIGINHVQAVLLGINVPPRVKEDTDFHCADMKDFLKSKGVRF